MALACLDSAGAASEAAHERRIAGPVGAPTSGAGVLARRQVFRRVAEGCCRPRPQQLSRAARMLCRVLLSPCRPSQAVTGGKWRRWRLKRRSRERATCARVVYRWLVGRVTDVECESS